MGCAASRALPVSSGEGGAGNRKGDGASKQLPAGTEASVATADSNAAGAAMSSDGVVAVALRQKRKKHDVVIYGESAGAALELGARAPRKVVEKSASIRDMIAAALRDNVLFAALDPNAVSQLIDAMEARSVEAGAVVIKQGDPGDNVYVIESGRFDILVDGTKVADWGDGTKHRAFGELALLYNSPRAASVVSVTPAKLWYIDRTTFRLVVAQASHAQHHKMKRVLRRGILEGLTDEQLDRLADAATIVKYRKGDQIIRKGDEGEVFFIIDEGAVICMNLPGDQSNNILHAGDYFGERALLKKEPRAADVFAATDEVTLVAVHRDDFEGLLGHLRGLLEYNLGMRLLLCVPILSMLSDGARSELFGALQLVTVPEGTVLLHSGSSASSFYIVKEGMVSVRQQTSAARLKTIASRSNVFAAPGAGDSTPTPVTSSRPASAGGASLSGATTTAGGNQLDAGDALGGMLSGSGATFPGPNGTVYREVGLLSPGHWFPSDADIASGAASTFTFVAAGGGSGPGDASSRSVASAGDGAAGGASTSLFVLDKAVYRRILSPLAAAMREHAMHRITTDTARLTAAEDAVLSAIEPAAAASEGKEGKEDDAALPPHARGGGKSQPRATGGGTASANTPATAPAGASAEGTAPPGGDGKAAVVPVRRRLGLPFKELEQRATLGTGTFGRVRLVYHRKSKRVFALKMLQKSQIVALKQQANIMSERELLWRLDHPFVIRLYDTYRDRDRLYMLLELVQGGELFSRLQNSATPGRIPTSEARFYTACVLDAFEYLHSFNIVYRDLKPENLLIDSEGYLKLVDFGFAKVVKDRTYTLCGTPEYLAPELVLSRGHDKGVDYWALGVLLYEQVSGYSPFADRVANDQMTICRNIIRGEVEFPPHVRDADLRDLVLSLLVKDTTKRLGCLKGGAGDVKAHRFFAGAGFDWGKLRRREMRAPWLPRLANPLDTSNFDEYDEEDRVKPYEEAAGEVEWDADF